MTYGVYLRNKRGDPVITRDELPWVIIQKVTISSDVVATGGEHVFLASDVPTFSGKVLMFKPRAGQWIAPYGGFIRTGGLHLYTSNQADIDLLILDRSDQTPSDPPLGAALFSTTGDVLWSADQETAAINQTTLVTATSFPDTATGSFTDVIINGSAAALTGFAAWIEVPDAFCNSVALQYHSATQLKLTYKRVYTNNEAGAGTFGAFYRYDVNLLTGDAT